LDLFVQILNGKGFLVNLLTQLAFDLNEPTLPSTRLFQVSLGLNDLSFNAGMRGFHSHVLLVELFLMPMLVAVVDGMKDICHVFLLGRSELGS